MNGVIIGGIVAVVVIAVIAFAMLKKGGSSQTSTASPTTSDAPRASAPEQTSAQEQKKHWLVGKSGDVQNKNFHIGEQTVSIGRAASNFIQITDSDASRIHCRLVPVASGLQVHDMDSSNGIFVNDKKVKRHLLNDQDELRIGECRFVYHLTGDLTETERENKQVNTDILRPTVQYDGEVMTELIVQALRESKGDVARVAEAVDLPPEKVEAIGKKFGVL